VNILLINGILFNKWICDSYWFLISIFSGGSSRNTSIPDVFSFFSSSCYRGGFTDKKDGFYTVYRKVFFDIFNKDFEYKKDDGVPHFGDSESDLEDVANFYGYWTSYCTSMSFAWCDQVDIREAKNRWMEKQINKENKKFRDEERIKFNESVRQLAYFCRRRDPRWKRRVEQFEEKNAANALKREEEMIKRADKRREELEMAMEDETIKKQKQEYLQKLKVANG